MGFYKKLVIAAEEGDLSAIRIINNIKAQARRKLIKQPDITVNGGRVQVWKREPMKKSEATAPIAGIQENDSIQRQYEMDLYSTAITANIEGLYEAINKHHRNQF